MRTLLITGICGFVGSSLARLFRASYAAADLRIVGLDNLVRTGSSTNLDPLGRAGVTVVHGDVRCPSDLDDLPAADWVIDAAANPSVLAGRSGGGESRRLMESNLIGTLNLLELCKRTNAGLILLSTSRVYSLEAAAALPMVVQADAFRLSLGDPAIPGVSDHGIGESFTTRPPVSLYGSSKLASEQLAIEYSLAFGFPAWVNRCGVLAGAGQFGRADQGIFSCWLHSWRAKRRLACIGFGGHGHQVRDALHPQDLFRLIDKQISARQELSDERIFNVSGGQASARSLAQVSAWCRQRWGDHAVASSAEDRPYDIPWMVLDSRLAMNRWNWHPEIAMDDILEEIATFAEQRPDWLTVSGA